MKITTFIKMTPKYKGFHIWNMDNQCFCSAKFIRDMAKRYFEQCYNREEEKKTATSKEMFDLFKDAFDCSPYYFIEVPRHIGFGIYMPDFKEYLNALSLRGLK